MPRVAKKSAEQRRREASQRQRQYYVENAEDRRSENATRLKYLRESEDYRSNERSRDAIRRATWRLDTRKRTEEQMRDTIAHRDLRQDPVFRAEEQMRDTLEHQERRRDPTRRRLERVANTSNRRMTRMQIRNQREREADLSQSRVRAHRDVEQNRTQKRNRENLRNRRRREEQSPEERQDELQRQQRMRKLNFFKMYSNRVKEGPTEICVCCGGSWFPHQTKKLVKSTIERNHPSLNSDDAFFLKEKFPNDLEEYKFCSTCHRAVASGKLPAICLSNGLDFPTVPSCLKDLTCLEERLISPRIPFMRIISLGFERQCAVRGAVVNIPISVVETVTALPRTFNNAHVLQVHPKRRLEYEHSFMTETIRPAKIIEALRYLIDTELYRKYDISITEDWIANVGHGQEVPFIADASDEATARDLIARRSHGFDEENLERQEEINPGGLETLLDIEIIENFATERVALAWTSDFFYYFIGSGDKVVRSSYNTFQARAKLWIKLTEIGKKLKLYRAPRKRA